MPRDEMLAGVRRALGRAPNDPVPEPPPVRLRTASPADRIRQFSDALEALAGKVHVVRDLEEARQRFLSILGDRAALASRAPILESFGVNRDYTRAAAASAEVGLTTANYALADTGSLVMLTEPRLLSLLPACHVAVIEARQILSGLDELFTILPDPATQSSSMVLITGPSRTADIEMRLVRGVHGPGEIHVIVVDHVTASQSNASEEI
jgi:L-lactate dehydrogenase complex protein LldG